MPHPSGQIVAQQTWNKSLKPWWPRNHLCFDSLIYFLVMHKIWKYLQQYKRAEKKKLNLTNRPVQGMIFLISRNFFITTPNNKYALLQFNCIPFIFNYFTVAKNKPVFNSKRTFPGCTYTPSANSELWSRKSRTLTSRIYRKWNQEWFGRKSAPQKVTGQKDLLPLIFNIHTNWFFNHIQTTSSNIL